MPDFTAAGRTWHVQRTVAATGVLASADYELVQVDGNIKSAVGGGLTVGTAPAAGSRVSVWGYPLGSWTIVGCDGLVLTFDQGFPEVTNCYLPDGTSGAAWYTADGVLRGVTGGLDEGGATDYVSDTSLFTTTTVSWIHSITG